MTMTSSKSSQVCKVNYKRSKQQIKVTWSLITHRVIHHSAISTTTTTTPQRSQFKRDICSFKAASQRVSLSILINEVVVNIIFKALILFTHKITNHLSSLGTVFSMN